ncbi:hypothetical protein LTR27_007614 [Elasticomyces elasticus]|nr:hypothetical protein LTR27_007614 [Elasticomyces elasticus]
MATRRSKRVTGKKLSNDFDKIIARSKAQVHRETATATRRSTRTSENKLANGSLSLQEFQARLTQPFRLLDLPPELREYIYAYMTIANYRRSLERLKAPVIALVSKQIRAEVLPQFFAQELHQGYIISNYTQIKLVVDQRNALDGPSLHEIIRKRLLKDDEVRPQNYGIHNNTTRTKKILEALRQHEQYVPLFRNVALKVLSGYDGAHGIQPKVECLDFVFSVPTRRVLRPQVTLIEPDGGSLFPDEVAKTLKRVRAKMEEIAEGRERFLGFMFEDLEVLAKEFCFCFESV